MSAPPQWLELILKMEMDDHETSHLLENTKREDRSKHEKENRNQSRTSIYIQRKDREDKHQQEENPDKDCDIDYRHDEHEYCSIESLTHLFSFLVNMAESKNRMTDITTAASARLYVGNLSIPKSP